MSFKFDVIDYLEFLDLDYKAEGSNVRKGFVAINCPICNSDPSYHHNIKWDGTYSHCFICDFKQTDPILIIQEVLNAGKSFTFLETLRIIKEFPFYGEKGEIGSKITKQKKDVSERNVQLFNKVWNGFLPFKDQQYLQYMSSRGFDVEYCKRFQVKIGTIQGKYSFFKRVILPIKNPEDGQIVNFTGRVIDQSNPKYKNCPNELAIETGENCVFGLWESLFVPGDYIVIVEGPLDALKLLQNDIRAISLMKKVVTDGQFSLLTDYVSKDTTIFICLDADAFDDDWKKIEEKLSLYYSRVKTVFLKGKKDLGDCNAEEIADLERLLLKLSF